MIHWNLAMLVNIGTAAAAVVLVVAFICVCVLLCTDEYKDEREEQRALLQGVSTNALNEPDCIDPDDISASEETFKVLPHITVRVFDYVDHSNIKRTGCEIRIDCRDLPYPKYLTLVIPVSPPIKVHSQEKPFNDERVDVTFEDAQEMVGEYFRRRLSYPE